MSTVEKFDADDEMHRLISKQNALYGKGDVTSLTYDETFTGLYGVAVMRLQYGWSCRIFNVVKVGTGKVRLNFLGRSLNVKSNYFGD